MDIRRTFLTSICSGFLISIALVLISCGGSSSDSAGTTTDTTTAVTNTSKVIMSVLDTNATAIAAVTTDSPALDSILDSVGITLADTSSTGLTDDLGDFLGTMLDENTAVITRSGNTITVIPDVTKFCDQYATTTGITTDDELYTTCKDIMIDVRLMIETTGAETGTLIVSHMGNSPIQVQYSPTQLIYTINLAGAVAALESLMAVVDPAASLDLPATVAGVVVIDMEVLGEQHASTTLNITQAITLVDSIEGIDVTIAPATLFSAEVDGITGTATVSSSLNAMTGSYPVDVGTSSAPNTVPGSFDLTGATLSLTITDAGEGLTGDVGIGPLNIKLNNADAVNFLLDPQFSINPTTGVIALDTALDLDMTVTDTFTFFDMDGNLRITAPAGTSFTEVGTTDAIYKVLSGSINISSTLDTFNGTVGTISVGQCFNTDGLVVTCP